MVTDEDWKLPLNEWNGVSPPATGEFSWTLNSLTHSYKSSDTAAILLRAGRF
jgi:hypothetical protein